MFHYVPCSNSPIDWGCTFVTCSASAFKAKVYGVLPSDVVAFGNSSWQSYLLEQLPISETGKQGMEQHYQLIRLQMIYFFTDENVHSNG